MKMGNGVRQFFPRRSERERERSLQSRVVFGEREIRSGVDVMSVRFIVMFSDNERIISLSCIEFSESGMPAGGSMFEKVLKRLCPCYYNRRKNELTTPEKTSRRTTSSGSTTNSSTETTTTTTTTTTTNATTTTPSTQYNWKGSMNLVQPQPVYIFPFDPKKAVKKKRKNVLKPPVLWKKATKTLHSKGPPVFQDFRHEDDSKKVKVKRHAKGNHLKHSETVANLSAVTSRSTVEVKWLKSQSLEDVRLRKNDEKVMRKKGKLRTGRDHAVWQRSHVFQDVSHGVIHFTAAFFNDRKICMINITRLENLARKGREGNTYYSVVKLAVLPSEKYVKSTKILANCTSPDVGEDFSVTVKEPAGKVLRFSVFDASLQKQHEAVGHALLTLEDVICNQPKKYRLKLYRRSLPHVCPGNLRLTLKYKEDQDKFIVLVEKARDLALQKEKLVKLNTYVKVSLFSYGEKVKTKKSIVVIDSDEPDYNSAFTFQVRKDQIDYSSVAVSVRLKGFVNDATIGRLSFGPFFYVDFKRQKLTPWGKVFIRKELVSHWFRLYL